MTRVPLFEIVIIMADDDTLGSTLRSSRFPISLSIDALDFDSKEMASVTSGISISAGSDTVANSQLSQEFLNFPNFQPTVMTDYHPDFSSQPTHPPHDSPPTQHDSAMIAAPSGIPPTGRTPSKKVRTVRVVLNGESEVRRSNKIECPLKACPFEAYDRSDITRHLNEEHLPLLESDVLFRPLSDFGLLFCARNQVFIDTTQVEHDCRACARSLKRSLRRNRPRIVLSCPISGCDKSGKVFRSDIDLASHFRAGHVWTDPDILNSAIAKFPSLSVCSRCNHAFAERSLQRHSCSAVKPKATPWLFCTFFRLSLLFSSSSGPSFGVADTPPPTLLGFANKGAGILAKYPTIRHSVYKAFEKSRSHANVSPQSLTKLTSAFVETGKDAEALLQQVFEWGETQIHWESRRTLQNKFKRDCKTVLQFNARDSGHPHPAVNDLELSDVDSLDEDEPAGSLPSPELIISHGRIHKSVPYFSRKLFIRVCRPIFLSYANASGGEDDDSRLHHLIRLLQIPAAALTISPARKRRKKSKKLNAHLRNLLIEAEGGEILSTPNGSRNAAPNFDVVSAKINNALQLKRNGHLSRGRMALESSGLADLENPANATKMESLFPNRDSKTPLPELPRGAPFLAMDVKMLKQVIKDCDNGSGASPSGWTGAHLRILSRDPDCMKGITALCTDIINGSLDDRAKPYLLAARGVAPLKPNGGLRPVCIGETFYKVSAKYLARLNKDNFIETLLPVNYGVGVKSGIEFIGTVAQSFLAPGCAEKRIAIKKDVVNAHNSIDRGTVLEELFRQNRLSSMWRLSRWSYSTPSPVYLVDRYNKIFKTLHSSQGVRQGDPLSQGLFCVGVTPTIASVDHKDILVLADVDDVLIIGKPTDVIKASELLDRKLAKIGLKTCPGKEKFISFHPEHFDDSKTLEDLPAGTETVEDGFTFAGTPIARDNSFFAALLAPILSETEDLLSLLSHPLMPLRWLPFSSTMRER